jgi:ribosomal 50S subunit-recycling heat shock protein
LCHESVPSKTDFVCEEHEVKINGKKTINKVEIFLDESITIFVKSNSVKIKLNAKNKIAKSKNNL